MTRTSRGPLAEWIWSRRAKLTAVAVVLMAVVSTGQTAWYSWEQQKCNENFAQNLATRSTWAQQDRRAEHAKDLDAQVFWSAVLANPKDRDTNLRLFRTWVKSITHSNTVYERNSVRRDATPLPDLAACD